MRQVIFLAVILGVASAGRLDNLYLPANQRTTLPGQYFGLSGQYSGSSTQYSGSLSQSYGTPRQYSGSATQYSGLSRQVTGPIRPYSGAQGQQFGSDGKYSASAELSNQYSASAGQYAQQGGILRLDNNPNAGDGSYSYAYQTNNGISAEEAGASRNDAQLAEGGFSYTSPEGQLISVKYTADENGFHPLGDHFPTAPAIPDAILKSIESNKAAAARGEYQEGQYNEQEDQKQYGVPVGQYNGQLDGQIQRSYASPVVSQYRAPVGSLGQYKPQVRAQLQKTFGSSTAISKYDSPISSQNANNAQFSIQGDKEGYRY